VYGIDSHKTLTLTKLFLNSARKLDFRLLAVKTVSSNQGGKPAGIDLKLLSSLEEKINKVPKLKDI
jgi:hypothetical protein